MHWRGHLDLHYSLQDGRTVAHDRHSGPLRVLKALYPGDGWHCEHTLVHPPGGVAGGDELQLSLTLQAGSRVVITTPGATRYYRSTGPLGSQSVQARLGEGARLEWLPLENIAYSGCHALNSARFELAGGAQMIGWDVLSLGLPASGEPFVQGSIQQHLELPGVWLDRGLVAAHDRRLLQSPLGFAGLEVVGTLWCSAGTPWRLAELEDLVEQARHAGARADEDPAGFPLGAGDGAWGVSAPNDRAVVCRMLARRTEPVFQRFRAVRKAWRQHLWQAPPAEPRIWSL